MDKYFEAKAILFHKHLSSHGQAIINCLDPFWKRAIEAAKGKNRLCIGFGNSTCKSDFFQHAQSRFSDHRFLEYDAQSSSTSGIRGHWTLWRDSATPLSQTPYHVRLLGAVQHENLTAAAAMMVSLGYPLPQIAHTTHSITPIPGRLEPVDMGISRSDFPCVLVDYAHSPDALEKTLNTCRTMLENDGRLICVFGCGGDRDQTKRPKMGDIASRLAHKTWVTSDNPRTEPPEFILGQILAGISQDFIKNVFSETDRSTAIKRAISEANDKDIVLIAGKGHEEYQIIGTTKHPFSDLEVARQALQEKYKE